MPLDVKHNDENKQILTMIAEDTLDVPDATGSDTCCQGTQYVETLAAAAVTLWRMLLMHDSGTRTQVMQALPTCQMIRICVDILADVCR